MYYQNQSTREVWMGNPVKNLARNYVKKTPFLHRFQYEGRINGMETTDYYLLKSLEVKIIAGLYDLKAA